MGFCRIQPSITSPVPRPSTNDPLDGFAGVHACVGGRRLLNFSGCDYLGLASDRRCVAAARSALAIAGLSSRSSRTVAGTLAVHVELERAIARFLGTPDAVCVPSGFLATPLGAMALAEPGDCVFVMHGAHGAVFSAAKLSTLPVIPLKTEDPAELERALGAHRRARPLLYTDARSIFRTTARPLAEYARILDRRGGWMLVDDAHGVGVVGRSGRGAFDAIPPRTRVALAGSLSKAFGAQGGFLAASAALCARARKTILYTASTPLSPPLAAAAVRAIQIAGSGEGASRRNRCREHVRRLTNALRDRNIPFYADPETPWVCLTGAGDADARRTPLRRLSELLYQKGILAPWLRYGDGPRSGYVRITVTALHRPAHVTALVAALDGVCGRS
jgi:7-keto-8-aminopelargonate synthetase-like enzyme